MPVFYNPKDPLQFANWFDPENERHLQAYKHLWDYGCWDKEFKDMRIEQGVKMHMNWERVILRKLADSWIKHKIG
jgi:hypothetical protein